MIALLGQPCFYWLAFWVAAAFLLAVPIASAWERARDRADRRAWDALHPPYDQALEDLWWEES